MKVMMKRNFVAAVAVMLTFAVISAGNGRGLLSEEVAVSFNGKFVLQESGGDCKAQSENGRYWCRYDIERVGDEVRELTNFRLYHDQRLCFSLEQVPGSDMYLSNSGLVAFMDHSRHFMRKLSVHFYSESGERLYSDTFTGAYLFGFSRTGNLFGVGTPEGMYVISARDKRVYQYDKGFQFDISEDERLVAVAAEHCIKVYANGGLMREIETGFDHTRKVRISSEYDMVAAMDKRQLKVYALSDGSLRYSDTLTGKLSYRDLDLRDGRICAGIHYRDREVSKGILRIYDWQGSVVSEEEGAVKHIQHPREHDHSMVPDSRQDPIPWMFAPFDSMRTVWNYYEQHMGGYGPTWSYLHQGLDLIVPTGEPTYAVEAGIVKCVLTIGGSMYWRTAISPEQEPGWSSGWLYAHLIESTIQVDVGDTVEMHDYLGDIIQWHQDWGHIHFVEIQDSGLVWLYGDNEWGINFNPLLVLEPDSDWTAPVIEDVFPISKFGFCRNETSDYLWADSLYGNIDIIIKVVDYVGESEWQQPAFCIYYWVADLATGNTVFPRTLGQILNHRYPFYESEHYEPYATLLYKRDEVLQPTSWMETERNYYHILTNNDGDSLAELSERDLAFPTGDYPDGNYRIYVEVFDEYGNSTVDSMDVEFYNNNSVPDTEEETLPAGFWLGQNYPNPFNPMTTITYSVGSAGYVRLAVFDVLGRQVDALVGEYQPVGRHAVAFDGSEMPSGIYFYRLTVGDFSDTHKMLLIK